MSEKKQLNEQDLENVTGGVTQSSQPNVIRKTNQGNFFQKLFSFFFHDVNTNEGIMTNNVGVVEPYNSTDTEEEKPIRSRNVI